MNFKYQAKTHEGEIIKGRIQAQSEKEAVKLLSNKKLFILEMYPEKAEMSFSIFQKKVSLKDKIIFTKELAMMTKGGLPLVDSLSALEEQAENEVFSKAIGAIATDVKGGTSLSKAMGKYPQIFSNLYISITASGEQSGKLDEVLLRLADQLQKDYDLNQRIKNATTYPLVVVIALIGIMILMLVFVVPKLKAIFSEMGVELPLITRILLGSSDFAIKYWYILVAVIGGLYFFAKFWAKTPDGSMALDKMKLKLPIFGNLLREIYIARFARTMATLISSGLPMLAIIETVQQVVGNKVYEKAFEEIGKDIESGVTLSTALRKHNHDKIFPSMIAQMTAMGEKSGKVDYVLFEVADFYDKEVAATTDNMATLIEPILILIIGGGVGAAIAAVILPMYSLVKVI